MGTHWYTTGTRKTQDICDVLRRYYSKESRLKSNLSPWPIAERTPAMAAFPEMRFASHGVIESTVSHWIWSRVWNNSSV